MAVRISRATGDFTTAGTWGLVDATSYVNSESAVFTLTTAYAASTGVTTGVITVDGIALRLATRLATTGTMSVHLAIAGVEVPGTLVTINTADLPDATTGDLNGGWQLFEFATPVVLAGATSYTVEAKTSSSNQVILYCLSGNNFSVAYSTTATGAPAAGDDIIICGEYTGAGTSNNFTVTMNETASTDYGAGSTSLVTPALAVCKGGILTWGTTAATNYNLKLSGNLIIYSGGTMSMGTTGTPCPRDSTQTLQFDCGTNVDFGLTVRNLGTFVAQGLSRTSGKDIVSCKLNTDEAVNSTSLGVDTDTGWLDNDVIAVSSTTQTTSQGEVGALNGVAGASSLTVDGFAGVGGGLAFAHSGTSPTQAEVILLTRSILIEGASASLQSYVDIKATATVDVDWVEFKWLGSATANKRGINVAVTTGSCNIQFSSLHDFVVASSRGINMSGASGTGLVFSNNVTWLIANNHYVDVANTGSSTVSDNIFIRGTDGQAILQIADNGSTFTNNTISGVGAAGITFNEGAAAIGTFSGNTVHSCNQGISCSTSGTNGTMSNTTIWRCGGTGFNIGSTIYNATIDGLTIFGCGTDNISFNTGSAGIFNVTFSSLTLNGDTTFPTTNGIRFPNVGNHFVNCKIINGDFSTVSGIKTAHTNDINIANAAYLSLVLINTKLGAATEVATQTNLVHDSFIGSQKHDQTAGLHKTWKKYGTITIDTTANMYRTASPSERLTPNNASGKLISGVRQAAVASGVALTPSVYVRESVAGDGTDYNGARPRLIVKRNDAIGITSDTVLDTATASAEGAFEQLTATTATATDDGVMEFYVDCDGTTGWVNIDDWTVS